MWVAFANAKILVYMPYFMILGEKISTTQEILLQTKFGIFHDRNFNKPLTNDIVSFEQLGPDICH